MSLSGLSTDLYELSMIGGYYVSGLSGLATFDLFVRTLPPTRRFLVAAGLEQALEFLERFHFTSEDIRFLREVPGLAALPREFFDDYLPRFRFTGNVWAVEEGTPLFAQEPFMRVTAPIAEAQVAETALIAEIMFPTSVASRAARVVAAADGRDVMEFGARRAHGIHAAVRAARAAYIAGFNSTSLVEAGRLFGIPLSGTMAHSWVMAFPSERDAFEAYARVYGHGAVLLLDTYDTVAAARTVVSTGLTPRAVRLDSGDLVAISREVRQVLDAGGLQATRIVVSSDLDEHRIAEMVGSGAPIDGFGVGTSVSTSSDAPALSGVYKLAEIERQGQMVGVAKRSPGKQTYPCSKQVWRVMRAGRAVRDVIALADATPPPDARPLLTHVMVDGKRQALPSLAITRERCRVHIGELPTELRSLGDGPDYPVEIRIAQ
jgi:nicotinate phosphoribosyltransferase